MSERIVDSVQGTAGPAMVWRERPAVQRPRGAFTVAEIEERGLTGVPVWLTERLVDHEAGRVVAGTGQVVPWETALRLGLVRPVRVEDLIETRGDGRGRS